LAAPDQPTEGSGLDMPDETGQGLRDRLTRQGEDAIGKLAQDLLENPLINGALTRASEAREKASQAQEVAMGALNIPSASDIERLTRRVRSVSQRLEGIEDGVDRLDEHVQELSSGSSLADRLERIEEQLSTMTRELAALRDTLPGTEAPVPPGQERLKVGNPVS
jgi:chromosome segregation ATPase